MVKANHALSNTAQATNKFHSTLDFHFGLSVLVPCAPAIHDLRANPCDTNLSFYSNEFLSMHDNL